VGIATGWRPAGPPNGAGFWGWQGFMGTGGGEGVRTPPPTLQTEGGGVVGGTPPPPHPGAFFLDPIKPWGWVGRRPTGPDQPPPLSSGGSVDSGEGRGMRAEGWSRQPLRWIPPSLRWCRPSVWSTPGTWRTAMTVTSSLPSSCGTGPGALLGDNEGANGKANQSPPPTAGVAG